MPLRTRVTLVSAALMAVVLAATGFRTGLEQLVGHLGVIDEHGEPLAHAPDAHPNAPGLYFVGYRVVLGGGLRTAGRDAKRLGEQLARRAGATAPAAAAA